MDTHSQSRLIGRPDTARMALISESQALRFRQVFAGSGYIPSSHGSIPEAIEMRSRGGQNIPRLMHLTSEQTQLNTLARLFLFGVPVPLKIARATLSPLSVEEWCDAGLVSVDAEHVHALVAISVFENLLLVAEKPELLDHGADSDYVNSVTSSTATLARFMVQRRSGHTLDLCTGCGALGFLAAQSSKQVLATDLNTRAIHLATFNARLNGIQNIQFATGSLFEPVAGRTFDLITANPPCIIGPASRYAFRDSGMELDGLCRQIIAQAPAYLNEDGIFQCTLEWPNIAGADWKERLLDSVRNLPCDVLVFFLQTKSIQEHSEETILDTDVLDSAEQQELYSAYMDYFQSRQVTSISQGLLALRKRSTGSNWVQLEILPPRTPTGFGEAVSRYFGATDAIERLGNNLLDQKIRIAPAVSLETSRTWNGSEWEDGQYKLRQDTGFQFSAVLDLRLANLFRLCDGSACLRDLISAMAQDAKVPFETISKGCLNVIRSMLRRGFLILPE